ncbi:MAG: pyridoxal phosphate-dependent decarboxylase family protein [Gemmatimonadaceae bacterium]
MADWVADYRESIEDRAITPDVLPGEVAAQLDLAKWENPEPLERILRDLDEVVMPGIVHWAHPEFLGYFGSTSNAPALLGEIAAAALNVSAMTWRTSPAATEMETVVLRWIQQLVGIPSGFTGIVYDTASVATLHALTAAREVSGPDIRSRGLAGRRDLPTYRVYASEEAHSSVAKAAIVLGIGEANVVRIRTDAEFRLDAGALEQAMDADAKLGYRPLAVVATIGTTSCASVDPVSSIGTLCEDRGVWLHVDAAYGGAIGALPEGRWAMDGVERADSLVVNPHKWLFVPLDFSALYVRRPEILRSVFSLVPDYLRGDAASAGSLDYMDFGIQLGRRFRALKAWMVFRAFGRAGIVARIREHCRLAELLASWVRSEASFAMAAPVTMAVVCFRCQPEGVSEKETDDLNEAIVATVNAGARAYVTHTRLNGRVAIRVGIGNILTTEQHVADAWTRMRAVAKELLR